MLKVKEEASVEEVNNLTPLQKTRFEVLSAKEEVTLTSAEKRELEDLKVDSKLPVTPTVGYVIEGSPTVYVATESPKIKVKVFTGTLANIQSLTAEDFAKKYQIVGEEKPVK